MVISSPVFEHMGQIPDRYTCKGEGINPELNIKDVPAEALSLVLILNDPDAPSGDFTHWIIWNIDPSITTIAEGSIPKNGIQGTNDDNEASYLGPCPPSGTHRYIFTLFALNKLLNLQPGATKKMLLQAIEGSTIDKTEIIGLYSK